MSESRFNGRGAQSAQANPFSKQYFEVENSDLPEKSAVNTQYFFERPKSIVSVSNSPDLGLMHSVNPYQGCEHGCTYCYARNSHNYWGFDSALDFESKIVVKKTAPQLLEQYLTKFQGQVTPIFLSGNTDCYQPAERKFQLTRELLHVLYRFRYPVGLITKNSLILRDLDILTKLAKENLVKVFVSITTLDESIRRIMEPRTASVQKRLNVIETLSSSNIPVGIMNAPIIPGLTDHETAEILKETANRGSLKAGYALVRLNGTISAIFEEWIRKSFPARSDKVLNQIAACHQGQLNDSVWHRRQRGSGGMAEIINKMFNTAYKKHYQNRTMPELDKTKFRRGGNYRLI